MSVTSGFFNSRNGDRRYNARQMSSIFDGIINDGVFANIGDAFSVKAVAGNDISVGIGRAWFNSTWIYNDSAYLITMSDSEVILGRYDAVVLEVDRSDAVRSGTIKVIKGTPSSSPEKPAMISTTECNQYPLAYIIRKAGTSSITQADIINMIGTSSCPYITGILEVHNIDNIVAQWQDQWNQWYAMETETGNTNFSQWMSEKQGDFNVWFNNLQVILDGEVATQLASSILELQEKINILERESCLYQTIEDSSGNQILDNDGLSIRGKVKFLIA